MREMAMKTRILHYYSDTEDQQGTLKLTLDEMYLEVQVVEKISLETLELYFRGEEKTKISREASWDI